jgi:uncharacterized protein with NRDE domain
MCTVTFIATTTGAIITSNRDEHVLRTALPPEKRIFNHKMLIFPKDPAAGGTWYATDGTETVVVLLNGAAEKHKHLPPYRRSRGLIVLDLITSDYAITEWNFIDLDNVEPFTIVLFFEKKLYQLQWNGTSKTAMELDASQNYIWSSSTLYTPEIRKQRTKWFGEFLEKEPEITAEKMFQFHRYTKNLDSNNGLVISRNEVLKTLSITQCIIDFSSIEMRYRDLLSNENFIV